MATLLWFVATIWVIRGYVWPTLSNVEVSTLQALADPSLFRHDFVVREYLRFTPRFYWEQLILLPVRAGVPLAWSFALWHVVALGALLAAWRSVARSLNLGAFSSAVLGTWMLLASAGTIGGVYFYTHAPVPAVWAGAAAACGAALGLRNRPIAAFTCFGVAVLLQFLVGFYAGLLGAFILWRKPFSAWIVAIALWTIALGLVYLPMRLSGSTGTAVLDNAAFVEIYAQLRLPHHLVPSTWGWPAWVQFTVFYLGSWLFLARTVSPFALVERRILRGTLLLVVVLLVVNYAFIEVWPLALVAKLQPARITPLAQLVLLGFIATRVQTAAVRKEWVKAGLLAIIPLSFMPGILLLLAAVLIPDRSEIENTPPLWRTTLLGAAILLSFRPFEGTVAGHLIHFVPAAGVLIALILPVLLASHRHVLVWLAFGAAAAGLACAYASTRPGWPSALAARFVIDASPDDAPGKLGNRFRVHSDRDAIVLVPPTEETWSFKLYAERADVVDTKNTPFTDAGLAEWRHRMDDVLGTRALPNVDHVAAWRAQSPEALRRVATKYGAHYLLTRDEWHSQVPGHRIDTEAGWSLWELP
jgi:hypothetical protein